MRIKAVVTDIDGTLVREDKCIPEVNISALKRLEDKGVKIILASGRMTPCIEPFYEMIGIDGPVMAYNGALLRTEKGKGRQTIYHNPLSASVVSELITFSLENQFQLNIYLDDVLYAQNDPALAPFQKIYSDRTGAVYNLTDVSRFRDRDASKAVLITDPKVREELYDRFNGNVDGRATLIRTDPEYLEFTAPGVNKGACLRAFADHYDIGLENIMAIGDGDNDVDMVAAAGYGVAVQNAKTSVKKVARYVTVSDADNGAVAEILNELAVGI